MKNGPYELVVAPSEWPGKRYRGKYCYEHQLVYWKTHGIVPKDDELVHHLNEKKRDNRPENLQLKKRSGHARDHGLEQGITMADLICPNCGIKFAKQKRMTHLVGRSKLTFCSRKCIGEFNFPKANKEKIKSAIKGNTQGTRKDYSIGQ